MMPKLIIESHVPYVPDELARYFEIRRLDPEEFTPEAVADADAMIIRTRTRCNAALLADSKARFIATATIGTDHIDLPWCANRGITVASAPGCNAPAVAQYVMASLLTIFPDGLRGKTIGVVGVGHVGSIVVDWAEQLGMRVLKCDPLRAAREPQFDSHSLDEILPLADIVTFHVPHTLTDPHATHHLADARFFSMLRPGAVFINSARGPIVNTPDLISAIESGKIAHAVIDCWEGEPNVSQRLLQLATIATPHIAGYSLNGKIRATSMAVNALCEAFGVDYRMTPSIPSGAARHITAATIVASYDPRIDTARLKNYRIGLPSSSDKSVFGGQTSSETPSSSPGQTSSEETTPRTSLEEASLKGQISSDAATMGQALSEEDVSVASKLSDAIASTSPEAIAFASHFEALRNTYPLRPEVPEKEG